MAPPVTTEAHGADFKARMHAERTLLMLPLNVVMVGRIRGDVEVAELERAIETLRRRHALLAVKVVFDDDAVAWYEAAGVGAIPVRVVDSGGEDEWLHAVREEWRQPFPIEAGPLIRFVLVRSPRSTHLLVVGHHAVCDGIALTLLVRDVLEHLTDRERKVEPLPAPPPIDRTTAPAARKMNPIARAVVGLVNWSWRRQGHSFRQSDMERLHEVFWERNGEPVALAWEWSPPETTALVARCREERVTVNSALWTAFLAAQHEVQGDAEAFRHRAGLAVSTRDRLAVPVGEALGFYASSLTADLRYDESAAFWPNARAIHAAIRQALAATDLFRMLVAEALDPTLLDSLYFAKYGLITSRLASRLVSKVDFDRVSYGYSITNVGQVAIRTAYGPLELEAVYGPFVYSDVNEKVVGVTTVADRMTFALTCGAAAVGPEVAGRLRDGAMARLRSSLEMGAG